MEGVKGWTGVFCFYPWLANWSNSWISCSEGPVYVFQTKNILVYWISSDPIGSNIPVYEEVMRLVADLDRALAFKIFVELCDFCSSRDRRSKR